MTEYMHFLRKNMKGCTRERKGRKDGHTAPLHTVRSWHWETPGPPTLPRPSLALACTKIPERPQPISPNCSASIYHSQDRSLGAVDVPRREGPSEKEWELHTASRQHREGKVGQRSQRKTEFTHVCVRPRTTITFNISHNFITSLLLAICFLFLSCLIGSNN